MFHVASSAAIKSSTPHGHASSHGHRIDASALNAARGNALPEEIAFLSPREAPVGVLVQAASEARRLRVSPEAALITSGAISDDQYYSALARHLGVAFTDAPATHGPGPGVAEAARAGIAPVSTGSSRMLVAPEGLSLKSLLQMQKSGALPRERLTLTTPQRFSAWVRDSAAQSIAEHASEDLRRFDPALSAASVASNWQGALFIACVAICAASYELAASVWFCLVQMMTFVMCAGVVLRLVATAIARTAVAPVSPALSDAELPVYTLLIPLYKEARIARKLVKALSRLDYPPNKLDIKILVESEDPETREAFEALALPAHYEIIVAPVGFPRTKPRALNVALPFARGSLVTVYDAEDEPEPDQLRRAAARFAEAPPEVACLQARLAIDNSADSWIAGLFAIEYAALFDVYNLGLSALNLPMPLGGTSNHFRIEALRDVRGWDAWNVTEDADLGLRLARFSYRVEALSSTTHEEAPTTLTAWLAQRRRWQKGWAQTFLVMCRDPLRLARELGVGKAVLALLQIASGLLGPTLGLVLFACVIYDAVFGRLLAPQGVGETLLSAYWCSSFLLCVASILWPAIAGIRKRDLRAEMALLPLLPVYYMMMAFASWRAMIELVSNPYHWSKTSHGLARTSRLRPRAHLTAAAAKRPFIATFPHVRSTIRPGYFSNALRG